MCKKDLDFWIACSLCQFWHELETIPARKSYATNDAQRVIQKRFSRCERGADYAALEIIQTLLRTRQHAAEPTTNTNLLGMIFDRPGVYVVE